MPVKTLLARWPAEMVLNRGLLSGAVPADGDQGASASARFEVHVDLGLCSCSVIRQRLRSAAMRPIAFLALLMGTLFAVPGAALAAKTHSYPPCNRQPSESDVQGAKGAFQAGTVSFNEADYDRAILYWEDAFRRDCTATLLLHHLARAYEGNGNLEQAIIALRTFLDRTPDTEERPQILRRIEVFEEKIADDKKKAEQAAKARAALAAEGSAQRPAGEPSEPATDSGGSDLYVSPYVPLAVAGAGVVATVVGAIIYFPARSDVSDYESQCPNRQCNLADSSLKTAANDAVARANLGAAIGVSGLVLAAVGTGWYFYNDSIAPRPETASVRAPSPWVSTDSVGLTWAGRF